MFFSLYTLVWYSIICLTFAHAQKQNMCNYIYLKNEMAAEKFLGSCYWFSRLMDQRMNNKNTDVAVINIYCNYLQQNGELKNINILQETNQTIYDE